MKYLNEISTRFMALSGRERLMAIAALLGVVYFLFDFTVVGPQQVQAKALQAKIKQQETDLAAFTKALQALSAPGQADPLAKQRAERDALRKTYAQAESAIAQASTEVRIGEVIRAMVAARPGLTLVSLKTLPVQSFFTGSDPPAGAAAKAGAAPVAAPASAAQATVAPLPTLYKHGIEVTVQGNTQALIAYLQGLERNSKGLFWGDIKLEVVYPDATLKMTVHTLSARPELPLG